MIKVLFVVFFLTRVYGASDMESWVADEDRGFKIDIPSNWETIVTKQGQEKTYAFIIQHHIPSNMVDGKLKEIEDIINTFTII